MNEQTLEAVRKLIKAPFLKNAQALFESLLNTPSVAEHIYSRHNQLAALEANSAPFYGIKERLINAIEGTIKPAASLLGISPTNPLEAMRIFNPKLEGSQWVTNEETASFAAPLLRVMHEPDQALAKVAIGAKEIVTVYNRDAGGMSLDIIRNGFLELNSDKKLDDPQAFGKYGMGGSSTLSFCDYVLVLSRSRDNSDTVLWTLVYAKPDTAKQDYVRYWFCDENNQPFRNSVSEIDIDFGTHIYHIGYNGDGWTNRTQTQVDSPFLIFKEAFASLPLEMRLEMDWDRENEDTGTTKGLFSTQVCGCLADNCRKCFPMHRPLGGLLYRMEGAKLIEADPVDYLVNGMPSGTVTVKAYVFEKEQGAGHTGGGEQQTRLRNKHRNILYTQYGLTQGMGDYTLLTNAGYYHIADGTRIIVEVKLDSVGPVQKLVLPNREGLKDNEHAAALRRLVIDVLKNRMSELSEMEKLERASHETKRMVIKGIFSDFPGSVQKITCDVAVPEEKKKKRNPIPPKHGGGPRGAAKPPIPVNDPPTYIKFVARKRAFKLHPNKVQKIKFETDADPKKFSVPGNTIVAFLLDPNGKRINDETVITKLYCRNGRGFVRVLYTGEPQQHRTPIGDVTVALSGTKPFLYDDRDLYTQTKFGIGKKKGQRGIEPEINYTLHVPNRETFVEQYPDGISGWGITLDKIQPFSEGKLLNDANIPADLRIPTEDYPAMSLYVAGATEGEAGTVHVEFNLLRAIRDLRMPGKDVLVEFSVWDTYKNSVAHKATLDWVPKLSVYTEALDVDLDLKPSDTKQLVRRAMKNHVTAVHESKILFREREQRVKA